MSVVKGEIKMLYLNPFTDRRVPLAITNTYFESENEYYLNNFVLIYVDDQEIPFLIKRHYLVNLTYDDVDYWSGKTETDVDIGININVNVNEQYYTLYKLFLNYDEFRNIVISKPDLDEIIRNKHIKRIRLVKRQETKLTYPKIKHQLKTFHISNREVVDEIQDSIIYYVTDGYSVINGYLIRLNYYREREQIPLCAKDIRDIVKDKALRSYCFCWYNTEYSDKCRFAPIEAMEKIVNHIDLAFYRMAPRTTIDNEMILMRGVNDFYPFLRQAGDKMILENYISTTEHKEPQYGRYWYKIILSGGIPYIRVSDYKYLAKKTLNRDEEDVSIEAYDVDYMGEEKEVILPRNLLAELVSIEDDVYHVIKLSRIYPNQFDLDEPICNTSNLYSVYPFDTMGGENKETQPKK